MRISEADVLWFLRNQDGLTVVEYVVAAALLVGAIAVIFTGLEVSLTTSFNKTISSAGK
ncbi:hypothetical protein JCM19231_2266 [Vibrio ishigakensis]|uniref:Flp pilus assembly protein n=1 Tax=Vibrio ishigakensis TaxID=1481914 RepID=A0A0B8NPZ7_9VIBR|nr:Flp family type IVb pilin [Vibrio ishigakensis]GAM54377.1 hypothetical protein JCM19231_2266 [Vibrio ishigakensis]